MCVCVCVCLLDISKLSRSEKLLARPNHILHPHAYNIELLRFPSFSKIINKRTEETNGAHK